MIDLVCEFELPMATAEGTPDIAGGYMGIAASSHLPPSQHFLGIHASSLREDAKTDILWCGDCGEPGCWPLLTRITVNDDCVIWSEFEQPHRTARSKKTPWVYDCFGPFEFDRTQYELSLVNAAKKS
ncbi:MAG: hypothetical protein KDA86_06305 [Planctomycetaceae bacterium]|nr:hypothetical protein [Planctomycetaceae bacterium]